MTIIDIIRQHVESREPCDEHGRKAIVLSTADADSLRASEFYQRTARYLHGIAQPVGCRYICTLQFGWPVNVYEWRSDPDGYSWIPGARAWYLCPDATATPADPEQPPEQTPLG